MFNLVKLAISPEIILKQITSFSSRMILLPPNKYCIFKKGLTNFFRFCSPRKGIFMSDYTAGNKTDYMYIFFSKFHFCLAFERRTTQNRTRLQEKKKSIAAKYIGKSAVWKRRNWIEIGNGRKSIPSCWAFFLCVPLFPGGNVVLWSGNVLTLKEISKATVERRRPNSLKSDATLKLWVQLLE